VKELKILYKLCRNKFNSRKIMINYFALTVAEMGIGKIELAVIGLVILLFVFWSTDSLKMLDIMWIQVAIIFSCLPVAATVFPVSQYYKAYVLKTSSAIIVTTVISILTIPLVLFFVTNKNISNFL